MSEKKIFGADMRIADLGIFAVDDGVSAAYSKITLGRLETDHFEGRLGDLDYRADELSLDGLQTTTVRGQTTADSFDLGRLQATSSDGNVEITTRRIGCPSGVLFTRDEELFAPHASVEDAHIVIHDLGPVLARDRSDERMEWHFLDALQGRLDLDLVVDMTLPWIGRRRATHYFRVPIVDGTIDYEMLEDDVHWLEAAFLTIDLVGETLVLARDLPLVPYSNKALLVFPLEPEDVPVAAYRRVHLRNLMRPQRPAESGGKPGKDSDRGKRKSRLTLHSLTMENIKLSLHTKAPAQIAFPNGASLQLGGEDETGLNNLEMAGSLHYEAGQDTEPTALSGHIGHIDITLKDLPLGSSLLSADRLYINEIDKIELGFQGFHLRRLELWASRMAATNLRLQLAKR